MPSFWAKLISGGKNVHYQVNGNLEPGDYLDWSPLIEVGPEDDLRLDSLVYALSDKLEVLLAWDKEGGGEPHVFLPINGRGTLSFDTLNGIRNTVGDGRTGHVLISAYPTAPHPHRQHFTLMLDFSKQRKAP
jgi:hypothetical protein